MLALFAGKESSHQATSPSFLAFSFQVNTSPFAGREGKFVTSRNLKERLDRELERNLVRVNIYFFGTFIFLLISFNNLFYLVII